MRHELGEGDPAAVRGDARVNDLAQREIPSRVFAGEHELDLAPRPGRYQDGSRPGSGSPCAKQSIVTGDLVIFPRRARGFDLLQHGGQSS